MPVKFNTYLTTTVTATIPVELTDEELAEQADGWGVTVDELTEDMLRNYVEEKALEDSPPNDLCVHCSGYNSNEYSLDMSDAWEPNGISRD